MGAVLRQLFGRVDGMVEVRLVRDFLQRSKGYAYIDYETSEQVGTAVEKFNGFAVNKRPMKVARSLPTKPLFEEKTVFVKGIGFDVTELDVRQAFQVKGQIQEIRMPMDVTQAHKGYAYVEFCNVESLKASLELDGSKLKDHVIHVSLSIPMKDHRHQKAAARMDIPQHRNQKVILDKMLAKQDPVKQASLCLTTVHVKNLDFQVDDDALRVHFASCGRVRQVNLCKNAHGRSRGFGFVEFEEEGMAQAALVLNETELKGRKIIVSRSQRPITQKKQGGTSAVVQSEGVPSHAEDGTVVQPHVPFRTVRGDEAETTAGNTALEVPAGRLHGRYIDRVRRLDRQRKQKRSHSALPSNMKEKTADVVPEAQAETKPSRPLSNDDFRALFLGT